MITQTLITASPDDLRAMFNEAVAPLKAEIETLRTQLGHSKHAYTVAEVAEKIGFSEQSVRAFIKTGRPGRKGLVVLKAAEVMPGHFRIKPADLDHFLNQF